MRAIGTTVGLLAVFCMALVYPVEDTHAADPKGARAEDVEGEEDKGRAAEPAGQKSLDDKVRGKKSGGAPHEDAGTLEEITIEGEIVVPQVLFITARDRRRYNDQLHRKYLKSGLELARGTAFPRYLVIRP